MYSILNKFLMAISKSQSLIAIKKGLLISTPIVIVGTLAIVINNLPLEHYQNVMPYIFGSRWKSIGAMVYMATISITSLVIVTTISYCLAETCRTKINNYPIIASSVAFVNFLILIQPQISGSLDNISYDYIGGTGLFVAIITAIVTTKIFSCFSSIKAFNPRLFANDPEPALIYSLHAILPAILTIALFGFLKFILGMYGIDNICGFIYDSLTAPFMQMQNTLSTAFVYIIMIHFYWFFGIHGGNILNYVNDDVYAVSMAKNVQEISLGMPPNEIFTKPFFDVFVMIGGSGATLCFIIAILISARKSNLLKLAQISILPGICNVNELLIFGAPIVLNPIFFVPFIFTPLILTFISYIAISSGLVPYTSANIHWTTPPLIGGYAVVGAWQGAVLQLVNIVVGTLIYIPFVKASLNQKDLEMKTSLKNLSEIVFDDKPEPVKKIITRNDSIGLISRVLASDLENALKSGEIKIAYQPIADVNAKVIGAEALLRWTHPRYGYISPPVVIKIAEESEQISQIGQYLFDQVCQQIAIWQQNDALPKFWVSVNMSVTQLEDGQIVGQITSALNKHAIDPRFLEVEVTEQLALMGAKNIELLSDIHKKGVRIAIDDFGMGHSSLQYIKLFPVDVLKIDGSLSRDIINNQSSQKIVRSITDMCQDLNIKVVVEYVETLEQKIILDKLRCDYFQGYLFSPPLYPDAFEEYLHKTQGTDVDADTVSAPSVL